jgi:hypothetical protein
VNPSLAKALLADRQPGVQLLYGVATDVNTVEIAGSTVAVELPALEPVVANDYAAVLAAGADRLILGPVDQPLTQSGVESATTDGFGDITVTFPTAFTASPVIVCQLQLSTSVGRSLIIISRNSTAFTVRVFLGASPETSVSRSIHWMAIGPVT